MILSVRTLALSTGKPSTNGALRLKKSISLGGRKIRTVCASKVRPHAPQLTKPLCKRNWSGNTLNNVSQCGQLAPNAVIFHLVLIPMENCIVADWRALGNGFRDLLVVVAGLNANPSHGSGVSSVKIFDEPNNPNYQSI